MDHEALVAELERYFSAKAGEYAAAYLFGPIANGTARKDSDLDIAVMPETAMDAEQKMALIIDLAEISKRTVDIVNLATANGPILKQALVNGRRIANNNPMKNAEAIGRMLAYETDVAPLVKAAEEQQVSAWISKAD